MEALVYKKSTIDDEMIGDFFASIEGSPRTVQTYRYNLRQFMKYLDEENIRSPERDDVIAFRDKIKQDHKPATVQAYITAVRMFFEWTDQCGLYPDIAAHVKTAKVRKYHKKDSLTPQQVKQVLESIERSTVTGRRNYAIFALMVAAGLRDIEVSRACIGDFRRLGDHSVLFIQGKGHLEADEYVKIVPEVEEAIRSSLYDRPSAGSDEALFASFSANNLGGHLCPNSIGKLVNKILVEAGLDSPRLTAHSLRHTAVTLALAGGCGLREVQQFARHNSIETTMIYAHDLERENNKCENTIADKIFA